MGVLGCVLTYVNSIRAKLIAKRILFARGKVDGSATLIFDDERKGKTNKIRDAMLACFDNFLTFLQFDILDHDSCQSCQIQLGKPNASHIKFDILTHVSHVKFNCLYHVSNVKFDKFDHN